MHRQRSRKARWIADGEDTRAITHTHLRRPKATSIAAFVAVAAIAALAKADITQEQLAQFAMLRAEARAYEFGDGVHK